MELLNSASAENGVLIGVRRNPKQGEKLTSVLALNLVPIAGQRGLK
jgi:hypothetical protein